MGHIFGLCIKVAFAGLQDCQPKCCKTSCPNRVPHPPGKLPVCVMVGYLIEQINSFLIHMSNIFGKYYSHTRVLKVGKFAGYNLLTITAER